MAKKKEDSKEENIVEEEKTEEKSDKKDYNSIFDDDYDPDSDKETKDQAEDDTDPEPEEEPGEAVIAESIPEEEDEVDEKESAQDKSKEPSSKKSSNDKKKDKSKDDKPDKNEDKNIDPEDEIVLREEKPKKERKGFPTKKVLIALAIILALLAGAFAGYLYFKSTNKPKEETKTETKTEEPKAEETKKGVYVTADGGLNMREDANSSSKSLALIPNGTKLTVLEEKDGWYKVEYNGQTGWVSKDFVSETKPADMKTYTGNGISADVNPKFSIQYPADWTLADYKISKTDNGKIYKIALGEGGHGLTEGEGTGITTSSEDVTYNGLPATKITAKNNGNIFLIVGQFKKGNDSVQIEFTLPDGYDQSYIGVFDKMLNTFKFL